MHKDQVDKIIMHTDQRMFSPRKNAKYTYHNTDDCSLSLVLTELLVQLHQRGNYKLITKRFSPFSVAVNTTEDPPVTNCNVIRA